MRRLPVTVSNVRLSTPTRMPEGKYVNKLSRHPIVDVVPHSGQRHTTHTLGTAATSRRTYPRLRAENRQHLSNVVVYRIRHSWSVSGPPLHRLFDLREGPRGDPELER
jgi:hypothetical protein